MSRRPLTDRMPPFVSSDVAMAVSREQMDEEYSALLVGDCRKTLATLFKAPDVQASIRAGCKAAIQESVARVLEEKRAELDADVRLFVEEHWQEHVEAVAKSLLADELARLKQRLTGSR